MPHRFANNMTKCNLLRENIELDKRKQDKELTVTRHLGLRDATIRCSCKEWTDAILFHVPSCRSERNEAILWKAAQSSQGDTIRGRTAIKHNLLNYKREVTARAEVMISFCTK
ncbi:hypothetical protein TNCV_3119071 [Trichonephila clavipes]|uniref:Uncharacterized protein n=1 Tax=Trichonephila clavipes TaxID=2585209 RepID=A0A8X6WA19_TRICX|nr:hypothetical protein TNCV_3119071 [Trichonephila clavipes]